MYIPKHFQNNNLNDNYDFIKKYPLGILITAKDGLPIANHLPFVVSMRGETIILDTHLSKANDQWQDLNSQDCLVIFSEPNSVIDATLYPEFLDNVPTWNYVAIHCYGTCQLITDEKHSELKLKEMIHTFNPEFAKRWTTMSEDYQTMMKSGIVTIEIKVKEILGKWKLSQNKNYQEVENLVSIYKDSKQLNKIEIANLMEKHKK